MPLITEDKLKRYAERSLIQAGRRTDSRNAEEILSRDGRIAEFSEYKLFDIFLCHSSLDAKTILGLKQYFSVLGFTTYVDWDDDPQLDRSQVNKTTANVLRKRMARSKCLFFACSDNSCNSKWMPWECGYFDALKSKVAICPISKSAIQAMSDEYKGQEYLGLYPYVTDGRYQYKNEETLWIHNSASKYCTLKDWISQSFSVKRRNA